MLTSSTRRVKSTDVHFSQVKIATECYLDICHVLVFTVQQVSWFVLYGVTGLTSVTSFDATYLYQYTFILLYNLTFTSLPVISLGGINHLLIVLSALLTTF
jgi:hypothetical protein